MNVEHHELVEVEAAHAKKAEFQDSVSEQNGYDWDDGTSGRSADFKENLSPV